MTHPTRTPAGAFWPRWPAAALALTAGLLAGCLSLGGERTELTVYAPRVQASPAGDGPRLDRLLAIDEPRTSTALDSNRIAVRPNPAQLQVYAGAIWSDNAPALVQSALVDGLGGSGRFRAVGRPTDSFAADLLLELDLRQFEALYAEGARWPTVTLDVQATLVDRRTQRVLASRRFRSEHALDGKTLPVVVAGFEAALQDTADAITPWVFDHATPAPSPASG